ncbi:hypothetical protein [Thermocatellispora tengchongensis]|uniref:hypothetical protein n=1 Tax=Thermocatellispora tengchongensis TaxID=1073253 RepID=UPI00362A44C2
MRIEDIWIDEAVTALRPDFEVLLMTVRGLANSPSDDRSRAWLAEAAAGAVSPTTRRSRRGGRPTGRSGPSRSAPVPRWTRCCAGCRCPRSTRWSTRTTR